MKRSIEAGAFAIGVKGAAMLSALVLSANASADYKDGLLWSFEAKQGEADGTFDPAKFVDEVSAGTANPLTLTFNYDDPDARPYFTNVTVKSGLQGKSFTRTCLYLPQPTAGTVGTDFCCKFANATVPKANLAQGEATFFIRYSWDGKFVDMKKFGETYSYNYNVYLFDNARDYGPSKGWDFSLVADSKSSANPYVLRSQWYPYTASSLWLGWNQAADCEWIDLALTLRNTDAGTEFTVYACKSGESAITKVSSTSSGSGPIPGPGNKDGVLFGTHGKTIREANGKLSNPGNFRGAVAAVKLWNRALSAEEIDLVFRDAALPLTLDNENLVLTEDKTVSSLTMNGDCTVSGPGRLIVTTPDGITVNQGTATLSCPVLFDAGASSTVNVTVDSASKLVQTGEWSGISPIKLIGAGSDYSTHSFELRGENTFTGKLSFDRAKVYLYGGASVGTKDGATSWTVSKGANGSLVIFMGGTFADNFTVSGNNSYTGWWQSVRFEENCTNVFTGTLNFGGASYYTAKSGSRTFFEGKVNGYNDYCPTLETGSEITFATNCSYTGATFYPGGSGLVHLHARRSGGSGSTKEYDVQSGVTWRLYGENLINGTAGRGGQVGGTLDLNGFDQFAGACRGGAATGVVMSETPATWTVDQSNFADIVNANAFRGQVSLAKRGANNLTLSGASTTAGSLSVEAGTLTFSTGGSWASTVEVAAGATLAYAADRSLAESSRIVLADGAFLALEGQLIVSEGQVLHGGNPLTRGKYTSASGFVVGNGTLVVNAAMGDPIVVEDDMTIDEDVLVPSVTFKGTHTISGSGSITVLGGGIVLDDGTDNKDGYVIDVPLTLSGSVSGNGYLTLAKGASFLEATTVTNVNVRVSGTVDIAKGLTFVQTPAASDRAELILANAVINAGSTTITLATEDTYYALRTVADSTNSVTCGTLQGNAGNARFLYGARSRTELNCTLSNVRYFCPGGAGEAVYNGRIGAWSLTQSGGTIRLKAADNVFRFNSEAQPPYATTIKMSSDSVLFLDVENALSDRRTLVSASSRIVLAADQKTGPLLGSGTITSSVGATWDFDQHAFTSEDPHVEGPTSNTVVFADSVNVKKSGEHAVYFGGVSTSTGELQVAAGVVGFYGNGSWQTCPAVRVASGATLILDRGRLGKKTTEVYLEEGAKVEVPARKKGRCARLYLKGVLQDPGCYTKENCPDYIEGDGELWAGSDPGSMLIVR